MSRVGGEDALSKTPVTVPVTVAPPVPLPVTVRPIMESAATVCSSELNDVCDWTAVSNDPFITITAGASGSGKGSVSYTVASNATTEAISGSIMIGNQTFTVNEAAAPCVFSLGETTASFSSAGGSSNVTVLANGTNCTWKAVVSGTFITITSGDSGAGDGTLDYTVAANAKTTPRNGTITVGKQKLTITQSAAP